MPAWRWAGGAGPPTMVGLGVVLARPMTLPRMELTPRGGEADVEHAQTVAWAGAEVDPCAGKPGAELGCATEPWPELAHVTDPSQSLLACSEIVLIAALDCTHNLL